MRQITLLYRFEVRKREVWLLGVDSCVLVRVKQPVEGRIRPSSPSLPGLFVKERLKPAQISPALPRPAARFYRSSQRNHSKCVLRTTKACKYAWGHSFGDLFVIDSMLNQSNASRDESPDTKNPIRLRKRVQTMLKTNESAFFEASFEGNSPGLKLNKSHSGLISPLRTSSKPAKKGNLTFKFAHPTFNFMSILPNVPLSRALP